MTLADAVLAAVSPSVKVCNNCKGRGFVPKYFYEKSDPPCAMCDGKGFVPERKETS